jgi:hypothetical protein
MPQELRGRVGSMVDTSSNCVFSLQWYDAAMRLWPFGRKTLTVESFWSLPTIKLPNKAKTPLGSSVTLVDVCLDIVYSIRAGQITVHRASLAKTGSTLPGLRQPHNMIATRTGEGFYATDFKPESALLDVVNRALAEPRSALRRVMLAKWRDAYGAAELPPLKYGSPPLP